MEMKIKLEDMFLCDEIKFILKLFKRDNVYTEYFFTIIDENYIHLQNSKKELFLKYIKGKNNLCRYKFIVNNIYVDYNASICKTKSFSYSTVNKTYYHLYMMYKELEIFKNFKGCLKEWFSIKRRNNLIKNVFIASLDKNKKNLKCNVEQNGDCVFLNTDKFVNVRIFKDYHIQYNGENKIFTDEKDVLSFILFYL